MPAMGLDKKSEKFTWARDPNAEVRSPKTSRKDPILEDFEQSRQFVLLPWPLENCDDGGGGAI